LDFSIAGILDAANGAVYALLGLATVSSSPSRIIFIPRVNSWPMALT
jgi:hypothetical protein